MEGDLGWCCSSGSNNWDLHAVVRFACTGGSRVPTPSVSDGSSSCSWLPTRARPSSEDPFSGLPPPQPHTDQMMNAAASQSLHTGPAIDDDLWLLAFFASPKPETAEPTSPTNEAPPLQRSPSDGPADNKARTSGRVNGGGVTRSKRKSKKSKVEKEVTQVAAGGPPADLWAWRKYGQKPIKGSPYPRGYYRCSTDKECTARKQVERCRTDPATLIVTYTGAHSHPVPLHRNSLAGTTRNKTRPPSPSPSSAAPSSASATDAKSSQGSPSASAGLSPSTLLRSLSLGVGVDERSKDDEDDDTIPFPARLLLKVEGTEMEAEDHMLLFLTPQEPAPGSGYASGCEDVTTLFPEPHKPLATASSTRMDGMPSVMNIGEEELSVSGLSSSSAWEAASSVAAASSWG